MVAPAVIAGAATVGAALLQGIFQQKLEEEKLAMEEKRRQEDYLRSLQNAQIAAPMNQAQAQQGALNTLIQNWGQTRL